MTNVRDLIKRQPTKPKTKNKVEFPTCDQRQNNICMVVHQLTGNRVEPTPEICAGCTAHERPQQINPVTNSLAGFEILEDGVGSSLHNVITWFISEPPGCGCSDRVQVMNNWGPIECRKNINMIVNWLEESALDNNMPFNRLVCKATVLSIITAYSLRGVS